MTTGLVLGTVLGLGVTLAIWGIFPPREALRNRLTALNRTVGSQEPAPTLRGRFEQAAMVVFGRLGMNGNRVTRDLRVTGQSVEELAVAKLAMMVVAGGLPIAIWIAASLVQVWISPVLAVVASTLVGGLFFFVPDLSLREKAKNRRREFSHHLSAFLDLVGIGLAGGSGVERALAVAADCGTAWGFTEIGQALRQGQLANEPPWVALGRLGQDLGTPELEELAASLSLAGTSGARVRATLRTKAQSLRERILAEAETKAQQATERMSLPVVLMFTGFLGLIGYPAIATIVNS